jgi:hypothetical protein
MKKNLSLAVFLLIGLLAFVSSCVKDTFTEKDAFSAQTNLATLQDSLQRSQALLLDSLKRSGGVINYSVAAILASDASWLSNLDSPSKGVEQLDQVKVTISQYGKVMSVTTDASGIASFKDLRIGTVNVNVSKTGYTEVDFIAVLPALPDSLVAKAYGVVRNVGTMVPVFSLTTNLSTINGLATFESDLTNDAPEVAANVDIIAEIDANCSLFRNRYFYYPNNDAGLAEYTPDYTYLDEGYTEIDYTLSKWWNFDYYGIIKQIAFHSVVSKATTAADGSFSLKVPSTPDGLPIKVYVSEFAVTQKLLQPTLNSIPVWGVQSIRTIFGPPVTFTYSSIPAIGTAADQVQSAFVTISAPTGTPAAQPTTEATATAVLSSSGIVSVNITSPGSGYTQAPKVVFSHGNGWNSVNAEGTATVTNGAVTGVTISNPGTGYLPGDSPSVTFTEGVDVPATATANFSYSLTGFSGFTAGSLYTSTAPTVTISGDGTGATAHAIMAGNIAKVNVTNPGSGYTSVPKVVISDSKGNVDLAATADMTDSGPIASITYVKPAAGYPVYDKSLPAPTVVITSATGSGATATCALAATGEITGFTGLPSGVAYTTATVTITPTDGNGWAIARATIAGGQVTAITVTDGGFGFTSVPTVTITGDGTTAATALATVRYPISTITMVNQGSGYSVAAVPTVTVGGTPVTGNIVAKYLMMLEGINYTGAPGLSTQTYEAQPVATITSIDGAGTGAAATFDVSWKVGALVVDNQGSGYTYIPNVIIGVPQAGGTTATATASLGNGILKEVIVDQPGKGYTAVPNAEINLAGVPANVTKEAVLTPTVSGGLVTGITVTNAGIGYPYNTYTVRISTFKSGGAATANPNPKSGQIDYIQILVPGAGYASTPLPTVEIVNTANASDANHFGTGATATAVVTDGRISAITVTNAGSGYYVAPTVKITVPSSLLTAVAQCTVNADGRITGVTFPGYYPYTNGYGYTAVPTVTFTPSVPGKGTGATGVAILKEGRIDNIVMTNQGSGYVGKNNPSSTHNLEITPSFTPIVLFAGKTYVRDFYFGTGKRTVEQ